MLVTSVGFALKSQKRIPRFIGPYQIMQRLGEVAYRVALQPYILNLRDIFHVSQCLRYIFDLSHVIQLNDVKVRDNLTIEASPLHIEK